MAHWLAGKKIIRLGKSHPQTTFNHRIMVGVAGNETDGFIADWARRFENKNGMPSCKAGKASPPAIH